MLLAVTLVPVAQVTRRPDAVTFTNVNSWPSVGDGSVKLICDPAPWLVMIDPSEKSFDIVSDAVRRLIVRDPMRGARYFLKADFHDLSVATGISPLSLTSFDAAML